IIAVLAANRSSAEALTTTASFKPSPPEIMAMSDMNRSLWVALVWASSILIDSTDSSGDVTIVVTMTAAIAHLVVRRKGKRIAGLGLAALSEPEKRTHPA